MPVSSDKFWFLTENNVFGIPSPFNNEGNYVIRCMIIPAFYLLIRMISTCVFMIQKHGLYIENFLEKNKCLGFQHHSGVICAISFLHWMVHFLIINVYCKQAKAYHEWCSLSQFVRWLSTKAEELGVEIYPGFAASEVWTSPIHVYRVSTIFV